MPPAVPPALARTPSAVERRDRYGDTALHWAVWYASRQPSARATSEVRRLFELVDASAASAWRGEQQMTPLHCACWGGAPVELVRELIEYGPRALKMRDVLGHTPAQTAHYHGHRHLDLVLGGEYRSRRIAKRAAPGGTVPASAPAAPSLAREHSDQGLELFHSGIVHSSPPPPTAPVLRVPLARTPSAPPAPPRAALPSSARARAAAAAAALERARSDESEPPAESDARDIAHEHHKSGSTYSKRGHVSVRVDGVGPFQYRYPTSRAGRFGADYDSADEQDKALPRAQARRERQRERGRARVEKALRYEL